MQEQYKDTDPNLLKLYAKKLKEAKEAGDREKVIVLRSVMIVLAPNLFLRHKQKER